LISFVKQHLQIAVSPELDDRFADVVPSRFAPRDRLAVSGGGRGVVRPTVGLRVNNVMFIRDAALRVQRLVMWLDVKKDEASAFLTPKQSYVIVAGRDGQVVPGRECGEIVEPLPTQAPKQSIWI
jgi:hypothetical protein